MPIIIIITACLLFLTAYIFDLSSAKTKIPSVVLLLLLGKAFKMISIHLDFHLPDLSLLLPVLGIVGLILIVLEGSLELQINRSKIPVIQKSSIMAVSSILILAFAIAYIFHIISGADFRICIINAIPICIISSAIAIPSASILGKESKEFVIYDSSISDILGVLFFNFMVINTTFGGDSFKVLILQIIAIAIISVLVIIALTWLMNNIKHHIKFVPIIILVVLIYSILKEFNLPALMFIFLFGLFLGNIKSLKHIKLFKEIKQLEPRTLVVEVKKFKDLTHELTFLIRALFFIVFGYLLSSDDLIHTDTLPLALGIVFLIFITRAILLKLLKYNINPLAFMTPRGLITVLLSLSILPEDALPLDIAPLIIQIILITTILMMLGVMFYQEENKEEPETKYINEWESELEPNKKDIL